MPDTGKEKITLHLARASEQSSSVYATPCGVTHPPYIQDPQEKDRYSTKTTFYTVDHA